MSESKWPCFICGCMQAHHVWNKNGSTVPACLGCLAAISGREKAKTAPFVGIDRGVETGVAQREAEGDMSPKQARSAEGAPPKMGEQRALSPTDAGSSPAPRLNSTIGLDDFLARARTFLGGKYPDDAHGLAEIFEEYYSMGIRDQIRKQCAAASVSAPIPVLDTFNQYGTIQAEGARTSEARDCSGCGWPYDHDKDCPRSNDARRRAEAFIRAVDAGDVARDDRVPALVDLLGGATSRTDNPEPLGLDPGDAWALDAHGKSLLEKLPMTNTEAWETVIAEHLLAAFQRGHIAGSEEERIKQRSETALPVYPGPLSMSKDEVLERLCDVLHKVWEVFDPNAHEPNDCFCPKANSTLRFQTSAQALRWVESLVSDALRRRAMATGSTP